MYLDFDKLNHYVYKFISWHGCDFETTLLEFWQHQFILVCMEVVAIATGMLAQMGKIPQLLFLPNLKRSWQIISKNVSSMVLRTK